MKETSLKPVIEKLENLFSSFSMKSSTTANFKPLLSR